MKLQMVGCSHHNSSVAVREQLAFDASQVGEALGKLRARFPGVEAVVVSTCNRVELYTATENAEIGLSHQEAVEFLAGFHGVEPYLVFDELFERTGEDAVRHLFTVAASLDSMVVGEPQILSQVKQAYQLAQQHAATGPLTHDFFQAALRVAKRVATETSINEKRVSIASVAIDFAQEIFERFDDKQILVIGAGEMAEETLRYLRDQGARQVTVVNRSLAKANELAQAWQGRAAAWELLDRQLIEADLIVSTTAAAEPIVTAQRYRKIEGERYQRPLFILDLAIPRDFEPAVGEALGVYLYSIDDLQAACDRNRKDRDRELPRAVAIVEEETGRFMADLRHRATGPLIQRLRRAWHDVQEDELRRLFNKLPSLDQKTRDEITQSFERYANKLLHPPLESLRDESKHGVPHGLLDAIRRLFKLKD
ncbi:MAG TPA: glutamyl-tRNA reductase [Pirellulales bacterium]|jgi:glutamyl-tRNA reductase|nr:glutamyl-tRNA reductase [Pirellulales bacterium]